MEGAQHLIMYDMTGKKPEIVSRGAWVNIHGDSALYVGPVPGNSAYFWLKPGDCRYLIEEELATVGLILHDYRDKDGLKKRFEDA